jgi:hypothetical protein
MTAPPGMLKQEPGQKLKVVNYSLRPAKNIERKMMAEAFSRLSPIAPLGTYRYVGFGSEFFNDFSLYHQRLGIRRMVSIEEDADRIRRCDFNRPYKCIQLESGTAQSVLPTLDWKHRSIVWLDYIKKLDLEIVDDIRFVSSRVRSGSVGVWSVNANPWNGGFDEDTGEKVNPSDWPAKRLQKLRSLFKGRRMFAELHGTELAKWGLAQVFYSVILDEIRSALNDRNAGCDSESHITFQQIFHFRYADGQRMLTVGGIFLDEQDKNRLRTDSFAGLDFVRDGEEGYQLDPPTLTGREIRYLNQLLPQDGDALAKVDWLSKEEGDSFIKLYRYYPLFAESEL